MTIDQLLALSGDKTDRWLNADIFQRIETCLDAGVKLAWVVDSKFRTITVHRPDAEPQLFNVTQTISGEPHLAGFVAAVADVFAR